MKKKRITAVKNIMIALSTVVALSSFSSNIHTSLAWGAWAKACDDSSWTQILSGAVTSAAVGAYYGSALGPGAGTAAGFIVGL